MKCRINAVGFKKIGRQRFVVGSFAVAVRRPGISAYCRSRIERMLSRRVTVNRGLSGSRSNGRERVFFRTRRRNGRTDGRTGLAQRPSRSSARRPAVFRLARISAGHFASSGRRHCRRARDNAGQLINCYCSRFFFFFFPNKMKIYILLFRRVLQRFPFYAK